MNDTPRPDPPDRDTSGASTRRYAIRPDEDTGEYPAPDRGAGADDSDEPADAGDPDGVPDDPDETRRPPAPEAPTEFGAEPAPDVTPSMWPGASVKLADRYQLEEAIASGGAAIVWRAFDDVLSRTVAIKLLHPHLATDPTTVERFRLESINAARLAHPNVVQIYDTGQERDIVYLVMEYVDGPSLREILQDAPPLDPTVVAALGEQVAAALGEAHAHGIVHRDVKPANILVTSDGVAKVTDFGIAKALSGTTATLTTPGTVVGTAAYVAPEQLEGEDVDARADVYALGVVLYECLTGEPAFQGDTPTATAAARLSRELPAPRQRRPEIPRRMDEIVVRATRRSESVRYRDGAALAAALAELVSSKPSDITASLVSDEIDVDEVTARSRADVGADRTSRRKLAAAVLGGVLATVLVFLGVQAIVGGSAEDTAPAQQAAEGRWPIQEGLGFDPFGDGDEHRSDVRLAFDDDLSTAWRTETYQRNARFGNLKPGVGLVLDLGEPREVGSVILDLTEAGVDFALYTAADVPDEIDLLDGWGEPVATVADAELVTEVAFEDPVAARYWLLWLRELAPIGDDAFRAGVTEIRFREP